jgi:hypothetical protein
MPPGDQLGEAAFPGGSEMRGMGARAYPAGSAFLCTGSHVSPVQAQA